MALIICPECLKKISNKAVVCPNCGYPINSDKGFNNEQSYTDNINYPNQQSIKIPESDNGAIDIGQQIPNLRCNAAIEGIYNSAENTNTNIPNGKVKLLLYTNGIRICSKSYTYDIQNSEIIKIENCQTKIFQHRHKSVISRAIIGFLTMGAIGEIYLQQVIDSFEHNKVLIGTSEIISILNLIFITLIGSLGAIIGGITGLRIKNGGYRVIQHIVIYYQDINNRFPQSITIECNEYQDVYAFISRHQKEVAN